MQELHKRICKMNSMQPFWKWILKCHRFNTQYLLWNIDSHWINNYNTFVCEQETKWSVAHRVLRQTLVCLYRIFQYRWGRWSRFYLGRALHKPKKRERYKHSKQQQMARMETINSISHKSSRASSGGLKAVRCSVTFRKMAFLFSLISR